MPAFSDWSTFLIRTTDNAIFTSNRRNTDYVVPPDTYQAGLHVTARADRFALQQTVLTPP